MPGFVKLNLENTVTATSPKVSFLKFDIMSLMLLFSLVLYGRVENYNTRIKFYFLSKFRLLMNFAFILVLLSHLTKAL